MRTNQCVLGQRPDDFFDSDGEELDDDGSDEDDDFDVNSLESYAKLLFNKALFATRATKDKFRYEKSYLKLMITA